MHQPNCTRVHWCPVRTRHEKKTHFCGQFIDVPALADVACCRLSSLPYVPIGGRTQWPVSSHPNVVLAARLPARNAGRHIDYAIKSVCGTLGKDSSNSCLAMACSNSPLTRCLTSVVTSSSCEQACNAAALSCTRRRSSRTSAQSLS